MKNYIVAGNLSLIPDVKQAKNIFHPLFCYFFLLLFHSALATKLPNKNKKLFSRSRKSLCTVYPDINMSKAAGGMPNGRNDRPNPRQTKERLCPE